MRGTATKQTASEARKPSRPHLHRRTKGPSDLLGRYVPIVIGRPHLHPRIAGPSDFLGHYAPIVIGALFAALAVLAGIANRSLLAFDKPVERAIESIHAAWFNSLMHWTTQLGNRYVLAPLTVLLAIIAWRHSPRFGLAFFLALPGAFVVEVVFKAVVARPRPTMAQGFLSSFPSGHTIAATVFWGLLPPLVYVVTHSRRLWLASIPLAILVLGGVGLSRIYLNDHWLSDVIGGYLGGAMFFFAAEWALRHPTRSKNRAAATALAGMGRRDVGVES